MFYAYIRVSTETQAEKGFGMEDQQDGIKKYAKANGLEIAETFTDAGISGNMAIDADFKELERREGLISLIKELKENPGSTVIVLNTSRLWRSDTTKMLVSHYFSKAKANIKSVQQPEYDLYRTNNDPSAYITNGIMELLDTYDRMNISIKLARGRATKARGGDKPAGVLPYGYQYTADKKGVEIQPDEAPTVKRIFSEAQKGSSLQHIADVLNADQIKTRRGNDWSKAGLQKILRNRFYIGELQHQGKAIKGNQPAIISKVQFGKVAAQLERRQK